ncbi:CusA/CzcA family heavy metal efflux RND transporter [Nitrosomonas sp.]|uniref:efflux RND transporter permease subunit n=1 Tax=Nitrosomonas sp. TaxID=42353 RepID=UPI0025DFD100|nr:CusA/CzcA family heavy metal efflux RND transporter [Nitrosomonas sp.]MCC6917008.1 efflux RND transporter permease subunit [Nitrosomonas sp.]
MLNPVIENSVHRRLAVLFFAVIVAIFGIRAYQAIAIEAFPDVTNVQVQVITQMPGYAAEEIERQVTIPLERALNGTPGMTLLRSESLFGLSLVTLIFDDHADSFVSRMVVNQRLAQADLPEGVIPALAPDATPLGKIYRFRVMSDRHDLYQIRSEMQWNITRVLRQIQGVADVIPFGGFLREIHVEADPARLYGASLTLEKLEEALRKANLNVGGGFLRHGDQELTIRGIGYIDSAEDIKKIPLKTSNSSPLTLGDVAVVKLAATPRRGSVAWNDRKEVVEGLVLMRRGENPSRVLEEIHHQVEMLNSSILPAGMKIEAVYDRSVLVNHTLTTVHENLLHGFLLVVGIVWFFLRSITGSIIVAAVIPLSLLVAFWGLHALGLPANLISMGAIDFGILVDGAVVLVENIIHAIRHERPASRQAVRQLVIRSAREVGRPVLFSMLIIIAALMPVFTLQSVEGRIFRPLALTYAFALGGALVFSLTVVPALCACLFRPEHVKLTEPGWIGRLRNSYRRLLTQILTLRGVTVALAAILLITGTFTSTRLGTEFLPELDEGDLAIFVEMPASIALEKSQEVLQEVHQRLRTFPETLDVHTEHGRPEDGTDNEGVNMLKTFVRLKPRNEWRSGQDKPQLIQAMRNSLAAIPGVRFNFSQPIRDSVEEAVSGVRGQVVLKIFGHDLTLMRDTLKQARAVLKEVPGVTELDLYRDVSSPQLHIRLNRPALARAGIPVEDAARSVETALAGRVVTQYWEEERPVPVRLLLPKPAHDDLDKIADLPVAAPSGARIPLRQLADIQISNGVASIVREGNIRFLALKFNVKDRDMGSVIQDAITAVESGIRAPDGHYLVWGGEFENQERAARRMQLVIPVAVLLVLGLLYAALNSGRSALAILAAVPFALTGGVFALLFAGIPLSVSAAIGFIALLGQASLMGVLVLSAAEMRCQHGEKLLSALLEGATERLRPVLMASLLALFGLLPMALSTGVGSETQRPFALVVVGGMLTTLAVVLLVLPVIYSLIAPGQLKTSAKTDT